MMGYFSPSYAAILSEGLLLMVTQKVEVQNLFKPSLLDAWS